MAKAMNKQMELFQEGGWRYIPKAVWKERVRDVEVKEEKKVIKKKSKKATKRKLKKSKSVK